MLFPAKVKHRKWHKGRRRNTGVATQKTHLAFGMYGLKALEYAWISSPQIEAARRTITRYMLKAGKLWIRVFPDKPVTKKGSEIPMGGGKGTVDHYVAVVRPGTILFEIDGIPEPDALEALKMAAYKLPSKCRIVRKDNLL